MKTSDSRVKTFHNSEKEGKGEESSKAFQRWRPAKIEEIASSPEQEASTARVANDDPAQEVKARAPISLMKIPGVSGVSTCKPANKEKTGAEIASSGDAKTKERPITMQIANANETSKNSGAAKAQQKFPRLLAIANQKGGVGKTTTAINLATALCAVGQKVLLVDLDPQGNASTGLGVRRSMIQASTYDLLFGDADAETAAVKTKVPGLSVVPSSIHLSGAEIELVTAENREYRLKDALRRPLPYDYVIIDCPPSLNLLTLNAMVAVDSILVPLQCEFYALEGLSHLTKTIERVRKSFNPELDIHGIALTMYDRRNRLSGQVEADVREHFGEKVYKTVIPRNVRLSEAPSFGLPAIVYDMRSTGAQAYIQLAREVIRREKQLSAAKAAA